MSNTFWLFALSSIVYGLLLYNSKSKIAEGLTRCFRIHCRKVLVSDNSYTLKSVAILLIVICSFQFLLSIAIVNSVGENSHYYTSLINETAPLLFILFFGLIEKTKFIQNSIQIGKKTALYGLKGLMLYNVLMLIIALAMSSLTWKYFIFWNLLFIKCYSLLVLILYSIFRLAPYSISTLLCKGYKKIIRVCYKRHFDNPLSHFLRYCSILIFLIGTTQTLLEFLREMIDY